MVLNRIKKMEDFVYLTLFFLSMAIITACGSDNSSSNVSGENEPIIIPDEYGGGHRIRFLAKDLETLSSGVLTDDLLVFERINAYRSHVLETPPQTVSHETGYAEITLKLKHDWMGQYDETASEINQETFNLRSVIYEEDGDFKEETLESYHTGLMNATPLYFDDDGIVYCYFETENFVEYKTEEIKMNATDKIALEIKELVPNASLEIESVEIHTWPSES